MSILKKFLKIVKKIFKNGSVKKRKSKKKPKISGRLSRKRSSPVKRKPRTTVKRKPKQVKLSSKSHSTFPKTKSVSSKKKIDSATIPVGEVTHYFHKIKVCVIRIDQGVLRKGDRLSIDGKHGCLIQTVSSMQIENEDVSVAKKGQLIGLKVNKPVYEGDLVGKL